LIDTETGQHLWAERFDKPIADLFDMQDEIVARLACALDTQLVVAEARRAEGSRHPGVLDLVFQGLACLYQGSTPKHMTQAQGFFERALAIDPRNVEALIGMANVDATMGVYILAEDRTARLAAAEANAIKALSLDPDRAVAHKILGSVYNVTHRPAQAIAECEQALALDRNSADAHAVIGMAKYYLGRAAETEAHVNEAFRLSPRDFFAYRWMHFIGAAKLQLGADAEAIAWFRRSIEANRNSPLTHFVLAGVLGLQGALDEARKAAAAGLALDPSFTIRRLQAATPGENPELIAGRERLFIGLRLAGIPEG
jgi:tetratricopeptide (TPR) repeat protein